MNIYLFASLQAFSVCALCTLDDIFFFLENRMQINKCSLNWLFFYKINTAASDVVKQTTHCSHEHLFTQFNIHYNNLNQYLHIYCIIMYIYRIDKYINKIILIHL